MPQFEIDPVVFAISPGGADDLPSADRLPRSDAERCRVSVQRQVVFTVINDYDHSESFETIGIRNLSFGHRSDRVSIDHTDFDTFTIDVGVKARVLMPPKLPDNLSQRRPDEAPLLLREPLADRRESGGSHQIVDQGLQATRSLLEILNRARIGDLFSPKFPEEASAGLPLRKHSVQRLPLLAPERVQLPLEVLQRLDLRRDALGRFVGLDHELPVTLKNLTNRIIPPRHITRRGR